MKNSQKGVSMWGRCCWGLIEEGCGTTKLEFGEGCGSTKLELGEGCGTRTLEFKGDCGTTKLEESCGITKFEFREGWGTTKLEFEEGWQTECPNSVGINGGGPLTMPPRLPILILWISLGLITRVVVVVVAGWDTECGLSLSKVGFGLPEVKVSSC